MFAAWALVDVIQDRGEWWLMFFLSVSVVVVYPAQLAYQKHRDNIKVTSANSLCATCKFYLEESVLCAVLDEHVTPKYTPCEGSAWEPIPVNIN